MDSFCYLFRALSGTCARLYPLQRITQNGPLCNSDVVARGGLTAAGRAFHVTPDESLGDLGLQMGAGPRGKGDALYRVPLQCGRTRARLSTKPAYALASL